MDPKDEQLIPTRPYLIRAIREWAMDNGFTPQLLVDAGADGVMVPEGYVKDGKIVLNVHTQAVKALELGNEFITFSARFGGTSHAVNIPTHSVLAVFTRENGQGIEFQEEETQPQMEEQPNEESEKQTQNGQSSKVRRSHLHLVK